MQTYELNPSRQVAAGLNNMNSKRFAKRMKDSGVSPVIATVLMVAITVVLAAVLYVMVSGFTHSPGTAQSAGLSETQQSAGNYTVALSSVSASNIPISNIRIVISGASVSTTNTAYKLSGSSSPYTLTSTTATGITVTFTVLSGNSATYIQTGDYFTISISSVATGGHLSGATVSLYNGNSDLGSTTL